MGAPSYTASGPWAVARAAATVSRGLEEGLRAGMGPALACVASRAGTIFHRQALGRVAPPLPEATRHETLFDLGDLTMPLATGLAAMWAVGRGRVDLEAPLGRLVSEVAGSPWGAPTLEALLGHHAGFPADLDLFAALHAQERTVHPKDRLVGRPGAAVALAKLLAARPMPPAPPPCTPSRPAFLALGWALGRLLGRPLDAWLGEAVLAPLGLAEEVSFLGPSSPAARRQRAAAGGVCPVRGRALCGEPEDLHAFAQGGAAGHAGLFASASGAWQLGQAVMEAHRGAAGLLHPATVQRFWSRARPGAPARVLAWQRPTAGDAGASGRLPRTAVGALSPRGALWIDPASQFVGVVLTGGGPPPAAGLAAPFFARIFTRLVEAAAAPPADPIGSLLGRG